MSPGAEPDIDAIPALQRIAGAARASVEAAAGVAHRLAMLGFTVTSSLPVIDEQTAPCRRAWLHLVDDGRRGLETWQPPGCTASSTEVRGYKEIAWQFRASRPNGSERKVGDIGRFWRKTFRVSRRRQLTLQRGRQYSKALRCNAFWG